MLCLLIFSRPFLVMRTQSSFNHAGPDEEPTAILLRKPALEATVGNDPTIGGPARVRTGPDRSFRNECIIPIRANTRVGKGALRDLSARTKFSTRRAHTIAFILRKRRSCSRRGHPSRAAALHARHSGGSCYAANRKPWTHAHV